MSGKWNLVIDVAKCNGCFNCFMVAKDEYVGNERSGYFAAQPTLGQAWITVEAVERAGGPLTDVTYVPRMCNHCDEAPCMRAAKGNAVTKRDDGIVVIDPDKARGQRAIVDACPYGAVFWNEEKQMPQAWPFDAHLLDEGWVAPRCVQVCPTGAITSTKVDDAAMQERVRRDGLEVLAPERGTRPRIYYRNLQRTTRCFVGGTVVSARDGVEDCVEGAAVRLERSGAVVARSTTDAFGEFKIDGLEPGSGAYALVVEHAGRTAPALAVELGRSVYVGRIEIAAA